MITLGLNQTPLFVGMSISPILLFVFALAATGITGSLSLLLKINNCFFKAKAFFIAFILIQSLNILYAFSVFVGLFHQYPAFLQTNNVLQLATPIIIYLFSYFLINPTKKFPARTYFLMLPALLTTVALLPGYLELPNVKIAAQLSLMSGDVSTTQRVLFAIKTLNGIVFIVLAILELRKHEKNLFHFYTSIEDKSYRWLRNALFSFLAIWATAVIVRVQFDYATATLVLAIFVGLVNWYLLFYFGLYVQPLKLTEEKKEESLQHISQEIDSSNINLAELAQYRADFLLKAAQTNVYLEPNCNLSNFAEEVGFKTYIVSGILNKILQTNFYDFISTQRAEHAAKMLVDKKNNYLTVDAIAQECGFKSKATFYKAFKKTYQTTPSQYQKEHKLG